jgi:predicted RNA-binding Zn-ribbon protein involved in translation (DUF1610 family)
MAQTDELNDHDLELVEKNYNSPDYKSFLSNDKFHHSEKGCDIEMIETRKEGNIAINRFCKTHNAICSKTGWELGYYMGTNSKKTMEFKKTCLCCGKDFWVIDMRLKPYCQDCKNDKDGIFTEMIKRKREKELKLLNELKPSYCLDCGIKIEQNARGQRKRCPECAKERQREQCRERNFKNRK